MQRRRRCPAALQGGGAAAIEAGAEENPYAVTAAACMELVGGPDNIVDVTNCVTRLRLNVKDETLVADDKDFKAVGTSGCMKKGKSVQIIIGLKVPKVRDEFEKLM